MAWNQECPESQNDPQERQYKISLTANTKSVLKTDTVLQTWPDLHWGLGIDHAHQNPSLGRQLALTRMRSARWSESTLVICLGCCNTKSAPNVTRSSLGARYWPCPSESTIGLSPGARKRAWGPQGASWRLEFAGVGQIFIFHLEIKRSP